MDAPMALPAALPATTAPGERIPATLSQPGAAAFWLAVILTGAGTGLAGAALTRLLDVVQRCAWPGAGASLSEAAAHASPWRHVAMLVGAGLLVGLAQLLLVRLSSGNGIDVTEAIAFSAGRLPPLRTLATAVLSVVVVGLGVSLGRESAPKQAGAVLANALSDRGTLSDDERRLLVACGAGAGMAAAYGVPLGGALFALEVMRGALALRMVLPALVTSLVATAVSWLFLPDAPTYPIPAFASSTSVVCWALIAGPLAGVVSAAYVGAVTWAHRHKPRGWRGFVTPVLALAALGALSVRFPLLLGNGKDIAQRAFAGDLTVPLLLALLLLKPLSTIVSLGSGAPGGLFTPSLALGAILGATLGHAWSAVWPGVPPGLFAVIGAGAVVAATTQGPISAVVLMMELTGQDRSFIVPLVLAVATATLVSRTLEPRSVYDARLTDAQVQQRRQPTGGSP
jgi:CIC family chloride channel protein